MNTDISQGSVVTRLGCGGVFVYDFVTNFLLSLPVKEFWKSANIWWSYGQELGVLFFDSQCICITPKSKIESRVHYVPEPAWAKKNNKINNTLQQLTSQILTSSSTDWSKYSISDWVRSLSSWWACPRSASSRSRVCFMAVNSARSESAVCVTTRAADWASQVRCLSLINSAS